MCGIIGYIGKKEAIPILLGGLARLEYRGYDSAGIAVLDDKNELKTSKAQGKLEKLKKSLAKNTFIGNIGIGHTRWATHGAPSKKNAHPHSNSDNSLCIVHNGIIENYHILKEELKSKGYKFLSDTDSEVIVYLIEEELKSISELEKACQNVFSKLRGSYAVGVLSKKFPDKVIGARCNSPLIVGLGDGENFIASDVPAIMEHTKKVIYLNDDEMVVLSSNGVKVFGSDGKEKALEITEVKWDIAKVEKGGYESYMLKEIHEQPQAVRDTLTGRLNKDRNAVLLGDSGISSDILKNIHKLCIVACGTAFHAGIVGRYLLEHFTDFSVEIDIASEFRYRKPKLDEHTLVVSVTQSGETADTLASIREAERRGCTILSICNVVGSSIARESDAVIYTHAGPEIGVASTKAYTAQLTAFILLTIYIAQLKGHMSAKEANKLILELENIPQKIQSILEKKKTIKQCAIKHSKAQSTLYLGRGFNYPTAMEGALKNKEISYIHAEGYPAAEMKHGPISLIDSYMPVICICTKGEFYEKMLSNIKEVEARGGRIIAVATEGDKEIAEIAEDILYVPETIEEFSPLINVIPLQLFAYYTAHARNCDIDKPRNLAKSVTVE